MMQEYYKWPYEPDDYSAGICLLLALRPRLDRNQYSGTMNRLHDVYRSPSGVKDYLVRYGLFSERQVRNNPEIFRIVSRVLCAPDIRWKMKDFGNALRELQNNAGYNGDLPLFLD
jgi:hypothetical protein